jgi:hypothetical protein
VRDFWACFVLTDEQDAIALCEQIAFQSRIGLIIANNIVKFKFLADEPSTSSTITESEVLADSLELSFSDYDSVANKFRTQWLEDYSGREDVQHERVYEIAADDEIEEDLPCTIYNVEFFVKTFQEFWGYRKSKIWKKINYTTFIDEVDLENFDGVSHDLDVVSSTAIKGIIEVTSHNPVEDTVSLEVELACQQGSQTQDDNYWPGNPTISSNLDPGAGRYQIDYIPPVHQDSEGSGSGSGGGGGNPQNQYMILIEDSPSEVIRGEDFTLQARIIDKDTGSITTAQRNAFLTLTVVDVTAEVLNSTQGLFTNGRYLDTGLQITGGSGLKSGYITISAAGCDPATCPSFSIKDTQTTGMTIEIDTDPVKRGVAFTADIAGGGNGMTAEIELQSTDSGDYLVFAASGELVDTVELDASGEYSGSWRIEGGSGDDRAVLIADDEDGVYERATSDEFDIESRSGNISVDQRVRFSQEATIGNLILNVVGGAAAVGGTYSLSVNLEEGDGTPIDYDGVAYLVITDVDGYPVPITYAGPDSWNDGVGAYVTLYRGEWSYDYVEIDWSGYDGGDFTARFQLDYEGQTVTGYDNLEVGLPYFVVSASVATAQRGTAFTLTIDTLDRNDDIVDFTPSVPLQVTFTPTDGSDVINISEIDTSGWSDGQKVVTGVIISGGSGDGDFADIEVSYSTLNMEGDTEVGVQSDDPPTVPTAYRVIFPSSVWFYCTSLWTYPLPSDCTESGLSYSSGRSFNLTVGVSYGISIGTCMITGGYGMNFAVYLSNSGGYWYAGMYIDIGNPSTTLRSYVERNVFRTGSTSVCPTRIPYYTGTTQIAPRACHTTGGGKVGAGYYAVVTPII